MTTDETSELLAKVTGFDSENKHRLPPYAEQTFLVDFLSEFDKMKGFPLRQSFKNFIMMDPRWDSSLFLNEITKADKGQSLIENVPRSILGDLQPYLKLYLVEGMSKDSYKELLLPFNNAKDPSGLPFDDITRDRKGLRVGFRSFSWDYLGSHPGDIDYWINCKLKLYFESPGALFHEYDNSKKEKYGFYNLIYRRGARAEDGASKFRSQDELARGSTAHRDYHQKDYRIKIEVGYAPPSEQRLLDAFIEQGLSGEGAISAAKNFKDAITSNKVILYLTLVKHTFLPIFSSSDFGFEMDIQFVGSIEQAFISDDANILVRENENFEQKLKGLEAKAQKARGLLKLIPGMTPEEREIVEDLDLGVVLREESRRSKEGAATPNQRIGATAAVMMAETLSTPEEQHGFAWYRYTEAPGRHHNPFDIVADYLKATSERGNFEDKMLLSPVSKLDIYKRIICKLNDHGKIYNLKVDSKEFENYSNNREDFIKNSSIDPKKLRAAIKKTKDPFEKAVLRKQMKDYQRFSNGYMSSMSALKKSFFGKGLPSPDPKALKKQLEALQKEQIHYAAYLNQTNLDAVAYGKFIQNRMGGDKGTAENKHFVYWFYYGDLLDVVLDVIKVNAGKKNLDVDFWSAGNEGLLKVILGNIEYIDHQTGHHKLINIAKVPISLKLWQEFWFKFVTSVFKDVYYFKTFLSDSFAYLVKASLTNRAKLPGDPVITMIPGVDYLDVPRVDFNSKYSIQQKKLVEDVNNDDSYYLVRNENALANGRPKRFTTVSNETTVESIVRDERILYMFDVSNKPGYLKSNDKEQDNKYGLYHLVPGQYNSPLQQISFTKTDQPFWLEAKAHDAGYLQKNVHWSEPYNCDFTVYGNTLFRPGRHIHIRFPIAWFQDPAQEGSHSRALGLGGYFLMTKASNTVVLLPGSGRLDWQTKVQALWTDFGGTMTRPTPNEAAVPIRGFVDFGEPKGWGAPSNYSGGTDIKGLNPLLWEQIGTVPPDSNSPTSSDRSSRKATIAKLKKSTILKHAAPPPQTPLPQGVFEEAKPAGETN